MKGLYHELEFPELNLVSIECHQNEFVRAGEDSRDVTQIGNYDGPIVAKQANQSSDV